VAEVVVVMFQSLITTPAWVSDQKPLMLPRTREVNDST
jgi:hypothetical protein